MRHLLLFLFSLLPTFLWADNIPVEKAQELAITFFKEGHPQRSAFSSLRLLVTDEAVSARAVGEAPAYYVFGCTGSEGFVIVAGDDAVMPVLGYSFDSSFPQTDLPVNLKLWLQGISEEIAEKRRAPTYGSTQSNSLAQRWTTVRAGQAVVELETAKWDQANPYNWLCPHIAGKETYTGCTATATAIVMRYHQWPKAGSGTLPAYTTRTHQRYIAAQSLGHAYDWDNMPLSYAQSFSSTAGNAVATLMRDCALMISSDFGPIGGEGTGAYVTDVVKGLQTYMGYDKDGRYIVRSNYSFAEWMRIMKGELDERRPVIYTGGSSEGAHAFVLDGYDTENYFRVNWGWSGWGNGYYLLSVLDPVEQGAGASGGHYNEYQSALIGLKKDEGGIGVEDFRFMCYTDGKNYRGITSSEKVFEVNKPFSLDVGFLGYYGSLPFTGKISLAHVDKNGNIKEDLYSLMASQLPSGSGYMLPGVQVTITRPITSGDRIRAYWTHTQTKKIEWVKGNEEDGCVWDFILSEEVSLEKETSLTYNNRTRLLTLQVPAETVVQVFGADGSDFSRMCEVQERQVSIDTGKLSAGTYLLRLQLHDMTKELKFKVGAPVQ